MITAAFVLAVLIVLGIVLCILGAFAGDEDIIGIGLLVAWVPILGLVVLGAIKGIMEINQ